jgi:hypothetical protein
MLKVPDSIQGYKVHMAYVTPVFGIILASNEDKDEWVVGNISIKSLERDELGDCEFTDRYIIARTRFHTRLSNLLHANLLTD